VRLSPLKQLPGQRGLAFVRCGMCECPGHSASFAACAACFSLRAVFRVCHDLLSVFGFGFSFL